MKNILKKLYLIRKDVKIMVKDGENKFHHYKYLSETQITEQFKKLLDKHGVIFFINDSTITDKTTVQSGLITDIILEYSFFDVDSGEHLTGRMVGQGYDSTDKGVYKAITGATKYIFMKTFLVATGDDPEKDNGNNKSSISPVQFMNNLDKKNNDLVCPSCGGTLLKSKFPDKEGRNYYYCVNYKAIPKCIYRKIIEPDENSKYKQAEIEFLKDLK